MRRSAACLPLILLAMLVLAGCYPVQPADLQLQGLAAGGTQTAVAVYAYRTEQAGIEATRAAQVEQARIDQASEAELALINGRAAIESTALAGRVTEWAIVAEQARATQAPQQTQYAMLLTEPARGATAQAIANRRTADEAAMRRSEDWADLRLFAGWLLAYVVLVTVSVWVIAWLIESLRKSGVRENGNGSVVTFVGLTQPQVSVVARRDQLLAPQQPARYRRWDNGAYVTDEHGVRYWREDDGDQESEPDQEPEPDIIDAEVQEPLPEYHTPWPHDPYEQALLLVRASLEVVARPLSDGRFRQPFYIVGSGELEKYRAGGLKWSGSRWQAAVDYLERGGWLTPGDGHSPRMVVSQVHTLDQLEMYLVRRQSPPPAEL